MHSSSNWLTTEWWSEQTSHWTDQQEEPGDPVQMTKKVRWKVSRSINSLIYYSFIQMTRNIYILGSSRVVFSKRNQSWWGFTLHTSRQNESRLSRCFLLAEFMKLMKRLVKALSKWSTILFKWAKVITLANVFPVKESTLAGLKGVLGV